MTEKKRYIAAPSSEAARSVWVRQLHLLKGGRTGWGREQVHGIVNEAPEALSIYMHYKPNQAISKTAQYKLMDSDWNNKYMKTYKESTELSDWLKPAANRNWVRIKFTIQLPQQNEFSLVPQKHLFSKATFQHCIKSWCESSKCGYKKSQSQRNCKQKILDFWGALTQHFNTSKVFSSVKPAFAFM